MIIIFHNYSKVAGCCWRSYQQAPDLAGEESLPAVVWADGGGHPGGGGGLFSGGVLYVEIHGAPHLSA
jgi:hypothetical protein